MATGIINAEKFRDDLNRLFNVLVFMMGDQRSETLKVQVDISFKYLYMLTCTKY
jgi:hypothetical protein